MLSLVSGPDDAVADWYSVGIETYPRSKFASLSDSAAEEKINKWAAGQEVVSAVGKPRRMSVAGADFLVSEFEHSEPVGAKTCAGVQHDSKWQAAGDRVYGQWQ